MENSKSSATTDMWWIPDEEEVWTLAVQSSDVQPNGCINFLIQKTQRVVPLPAERCLPATNLNSDPDDMVLLPDVNQATILSCTRTRYRKKQIYTNIGLVLMSVNPFEYIKGLYGKDVIRKFRDPDEKGLPAHVYMIPSRAYQDMSRTGMNQSILISGESGAGKTEATKVLFIYYDYYYS